MLLSIMVATLAMAGEPQALIRDRTVEQPFIAGVLSGLTLGGCSGCRHGAGVAPAGPHDPFGMSESMHQTLKSVGASSYALGKLIGRILAILTVVGLILRILHTLERRTGLSPVHGRLEMEG